MTSGQCSLCGVTRDLTHTGRNQNVCSSCSARLTGNANLSPEQFHSFDVEVSDHDALQRGVTAKKLYGSEHAHHRVVLSNDYSPSEAREIALRMAAIHGMPTGLHPRI